MESTARDLRESATEATCGFEELELAAEVPGLMAKAARMERTASDAEDLVQDVVERALRSRHRFSPGTNLRSWLHTIMHNLFLDRCRSRNRWLMSTDEALLPGLAQQSEPELPDCWQLVTVEEVQNVSEHLSRPLRDAARLVLFDGLSYDQAALRLSVPRATVGTRLMRARRQMRQIIEERLGTRAPAARKPLGTQESSRGITLM